MVVTLVRADIGCNATYLNETRPAQQPAYRSTPKSTSTGSMNTGIQRMFFHRSLNRSSQPSLAGATEENRERHCFIGEGDVGQRPPRSVPKCTHLFSSENS